MVSASPSMPSAAMTLCQSPTMRCTTTSTPSLAINSQDRHLNEMVANGDATHRDALAKMKGRWKRPISGIGWYRAAKRDFAALPEN